MKFLACLLLITSPIFNIASAQYISPQKQMSNEPSSEDFLLVAYGSFSFYRNTWKNLKEKCIYEYRFGAPAITTKTVQVFEETMPQIMGDIQKCYQQKYGKSIDRSYAEKRYSEQTGGLDIALSSLMSAPISAPKRLSELTNCNSYGQNASQGIVIFQRGASYPGPQWCEKLR